MSEIRPGYKQTEVGVIPEDWEVTTMGQHAKFRTGPFGSTLHKSDYTEAGVPIINPMHIFDGKIIPTRTATVTQDTAKRLSTFCLQSGDIIIARRGEMGRCAIVLEKHEGWICGTGSLIIRSANDLCPSFLQRVLSSPNAIYAIEETSVGTTMVNLNQSVLSNLSIQLPTLAEQTAIAAVLSDADALIQKLDQLIAKKQNIKQGAMQELLTGKRRLPGFSGEWEVKLFEEIASLRKERVDPRKSSNYCFCIELEHIGQGTGSLTGYSDVTTQSSLKSQFETGDVLFGKLRAYLRKYWRSERSGVCSTEIWVMVPKRNEITSNFLFQIVTTNRFIEAASVAYGTHMPRSDWNIIRKFEVAIPSIPEQTAIATVLSDMDAEIAALEQKRDKYKAVKQGMMQVLLTGKVRLV